MTFVAYLAHDLNDAAIGRRAAMLRAAGAELVIAGFHRADAAPERVAGIVPLALGRTADARLIARTTQVGRVALLDLGRLREHVRGAQAIVARNLEMLVLAVRLAAGLRPRPRLVYECLDIHRLMTSSGAAGTLLRAVERRVGTHVDTVLTSSPAFVRNHFRRTALADRVHLAENRVFFDGAGVPVALPARFEGPPWRIGWFGALRCRRSFALLSALAASRRGEVEVVIRGRPSPAIFPDLGAEAARAPGVRFEGAYSWPDDLPRIYGEVHFSWCVDFYEAGTNSDWLLPNRLYEGCLFGTVPIALRGVETGRWLADRGLGETLAEPVGASLDRLLASMTPARRQEAAARVAAEPRKLWLADRAACRNLLDVILGRPTRPEAEAA